MIFRCGLGNMNSKKAPHTITTYTGGTIIFMWQTFCVVRLKKHTIFQDE